MIRILTLKGHYLHLKENSIGLLLDDIRDYFYMEDGGKYKISITESKKGKYLFSNFYYNSNYYQLDSCYDKNVFVGLICRKVFDKVFFKADKDKRYKIKVERI